MQKRVYWLDSMRALAIYLIVLGHVLNGRSIWIWIYSFHVPLFIIISGYLFNGVRYRFFEFFKKRFFMLMIPYYFFSLLSIIVFQILKKYLDTEINVSFYKSLIGMLWANGQNGNFTFMKWNLPLWYVPMIFLMEILAYFIFKKIDSYQKLAISFFLSVVIAAIIYNNQLLNNLPFSAETVIYLFPFFIFGKTLKKLNFDEYLHNKKIKLAIGIFFLFIGSVATKFTRNIDYVSDQYRNYYVFIAIALSISFGLFLIFSVKSNGFILMNYIGKHTLAILFLHNFLKIFIMNFIPFIDNIFKFFPLVTSIIISSIIVLICLIIAVPINKILKLALKNSKYNLEI